MSTPPRERFEQLLRLACDAPESEEGRTAAVAAVQIAHRERWALGSSRLEGLVARTVADPESEEGRTSAALASRILQRDGLPVAPSNPDAPPRGGASGLDDLLREIFRQQYAAAEAAMREVAMRQAAAGRRQRQPRQERVETRWVTCPECGEACFATSIDAACVRCLVQFSPAEAVAYPRPPVCSSIPCPECGRPVPDQGLDVAFCPLCAIYIRVDVSMRGEPATDSEGPSIGLDPRDRAACSVLGDGPDVGVRLCAHCGERNMTAGDEYVCRRCFARTGEASPRAPPRSGW